MTSPLVAKTTYPRKDFPAITQIGLKARNLAVTHQADIEPRLPPGTVAGLAEDLESLGVVVPGAKQAREESRSATVAQGVTLAQAYARIRAVRTSVRRAGAPADVQRAYGVGQDIRPERVRDVKAALQQIIDRAKANPTEAAGFGLLAADVTALEAALAAVTAADTTQEERRAGAPQSTKERNRTANRVLLAASRIAGAGLIAFAHQPVELASFEALMKSVMSSKPAKKGAVMNDAALESDTAAEPPSVPA